MFHSNPNPDPSPATSGFLCLGLTAGEGKKVRKRAQPSFEHQIPVPAIVNEDNIINISPLGRGVREERLYFAVRHDFIVPLKKFGIMSDDFIDPNLD